jgi:surface protein
MSSFNGYVAFSEEPEELADELEPEEPADELEPEEQPEEELPDAEAPEDIVLPDEAADPETDPEIEAVAEDSDDVDTEETNEKSDSESDEEAVKEINEEAEEKIEVVEDTSDESSEDKENDGFTIEGLFEEIKNDVLLLVGAADIIASGTDGTVEWAVDSNYVLYIYPTDGQESGTFDTQFAEETDIPWYSYRSSITKAVIEGDIKFNGSAKYLFYSATSMTELEGAENLDMSTVTNTYCMFGNCGIASLDLSSWDTSNITNMSYLFFNTNLSELDLSNWDASRVTDMSGMFAYNKLLKSVKLPHNTGNVWYMYRMFFDCESLTGVDVSGLDTSSVVNMAYMFAYCYSLSSLDLSGFNTSNVVSMQGMFYYCVKLASLNLSGLKTPSVTDMSYMFFGCYVVEKLDLSSFDTSSVTTMFAMFYECDELTDLNVKSFNTSNVTNMGYMFMYCYSLRELDLSSFDTSNVASVYAMFWSVKLKKITLGPNVDSNFTDCDLWNGIGGIYLSNNGEGPCDANYIGTIDDLYAYQSTSSNRVDASGNPIANVYCLCDVIVYDPNGGVWADGSTDVKRVYCESDTTWNITDEQPTKEGESFIGWDRVKDYTASLYDLKTSMVVTGMEPGDPFLTFYADWEGKDKVVYDTNDSVNGVSFARVDVSGSNAPAFECEFTIRALDNAPEPTKSTATVDFSGEGNQVIDFGTITFMRTGLYHYEITQSSADADGWVHNNGTKIVDVTVSKNEETGGAYISSVTGVHFYNCYMGSILTGNLTEQDKADTVQKNHQQSATSDEALYKSAQWTDKSNGVGNIDIVYNNTYSDTNSTTALYIFTNCTAHGFTSDIAKKNIKFLLNYYDTVVAVCSMKTVKLVESDVTYEKFIFNKSDGDEEIDNELDLYLSTIYFEVDMHLSATWQLKCFDTCLDIYEPDSVFFSYDGGRGYDDANDILTRELFGMSLDEFDQSEYPEPVLEHYDKTLQKLGELLKKREFYIMIAEGVNQYSTVAKDYDTFATSSRRLKNMTYLAMMTIDPVTMSTEEGRNKIKEEIENEGYGINIRNYAQQKLATYGTEIYSYSQEMQKVLTLKIGEKYSVTDVIDPRFSISGDITVTVPVRQSDGSYTVLSEGEDYTPTITDDADSGGKRVTVNFLEWDGYPAKISVPITLKTITAGFRDSNDWFDDTNIGDVSASVSDVIFDGSTQEEVEKDPIVSIKADSPKLYLSTLPVLPTAGGNGTGVFTVCGAALVALWVLRSVSKRRYGRKK